MFFQYGQVLYLARAQNIIYTHINNRGNRYKLYFDNVRPNQTSNPTPTTCENSENIVFFFYIIFTVKQWRGFRALRTENDFDFFVTVDLKYRKCL